MLEKTEVVIKNGHSRDTGSIAHTTYRMKTNKTHKNKYTLIILAIRTSPKPGINPGARK
jgi:hypothetical protein